MSPQKGYKVLIPSTLECEVFGNRIISDIISYGGVILE